VIAAAGYEVTNALAEEGRAAAAVLGMSRVELTPPPASPAPFRVRQLPERRQDVLDALVSLRDEVQPDLVLLPAGADMHQDHRTVHQEGVRAFRRHASILGYEQPWNCTGFDGAVYATFDADALRRKVAAATAYESQRGRQYTTPDYIRAIAEMRGGQVAHTRYAECFELIRGIV